MHLRETEAGIRHRKGLLRTGVPVDVNGILQGPGDHHLPVHGIGGHDLIVFEHRRADDAAVGAQAHYFPVQVQYLRGKRFRIYPVDLPGPRPVGDAPHRIGTLFQDVFPDDLQGLFRRHTP